VDASQKIAMYANFTRLQLLRSNVAYKKALLTRSYKQCVYTKAASEEIYGKSTIMQFPIT